MKEKIIETAENLLDKMIMHRRKIHGLAEIGFEVEETLRYVEEVLTELGVANSRVGGGIVGEIGEGEAGILLRADCDALPIKEESGEAFAASNGNMHACGHDMHTAMLLGAAEIIKKWESMLDGRVTLVFQPAEEVLRGAKSMIDDGLFARGVSECGIMLHVLSSEEIPVGSVIVPHGGAVAPEVQFFEVEITGSASHGATPRGAKDALTCAARILLGFEELCAREFAGSDMVLTVGNMDGGGAPNAIADSATLRGSFRSLDGRTVEAVKERICEISDGICCAFGTRADVRFEANAPAFFVDEALSGAAKIFLAELLGKEKIITPEEFIGGGSEDFAYIAKRIPSLLIGISAGKNGYSLHNPRVRFDESVLSEGAAVYSYLAFRLLEENFDS